MSAVAGVTKGDGLARVIVTDYWRMQFHVDPERGEELFILPDLEVAEPVEFDDIASLTAQVKSHIYRVLSPRSPCGECHACCNINFADPQPSDWCRHCDHSFGCKIYFDRPKVCRDFECMWLISQRSDKPMDAELRPDRCGVVLTDDSMTNDPLLIEVHGKPNSVAQAWLEACGMKLNHVTRYIPMGK